MHSALFPLLLCGYWTYLNNSHVYSAISPLLFGVHWTCLNNVYSVYVYSAISPLLICVYWTYLSNSHVYSAISPLLFVASRLITTLVPVDCISTLGLAFKPIEVKHITM